jgi:hypothetical protein
VVSSGATHDDEHQIKLVFVCRAEQADDIAEQLASASVPPPPAASSTLPSSSSTKVIDPLYSYAAHFGLQEVDAHGWIF